MLDLIFKMLLLVLNCMDDKCFSLLYLGWVFDELINIYICLGIGLLFIELLL